MEVPKVIQDLTNKDEKDTRQMQTLQNVFRAQMESLFQSSPNNGAVGPYTPYSEIHCEFDMSTEVKCKKNT